MKKAYSIILATVMCCSLMTSCLDPNLTETTRSSEEQEFYDNYYVNSNLVEIDFRSDPERVMKNLDHFANHPYVSDEDKAKFELAKEVYSDYEWLKKIDGFDYSKSAPQDERSAANYYIADLLKENYLKYNPKLLENTDGDKLFGWPNYDNTRALFSIYKEYGNAAFGKEVDGVFVIDNYEEMYGDLDQAIMSQFGITESAFR